jgi:hypothetical protein
MTTLSGVTAIDTRVADVTVRVAGGLMIEPDCAVIDVVPGVRPVASPLVPCALLIVATEVFDDVHVGVIAGEWLPSAYVGVEVKSCVVPGAIDAVDGDTVIDTEGFVMVRRAEFETTLPCVAMMVEVVFGVTPVAKPPEVMVAPVDALHVTLDVMFWVLLSAYVPVAVNCCIAPGATDAVKGLTAIDFNGLVIVRVAGGLVIVPDVAVMDEVVFGVTPVARPPEVIVAPAVAFQVTLDVRFFVLWSA